MQRTETDTMYLRRQIWPLNLTLVYIFLKLIWQIQLNPELLRTPLRPEKVSVFSEYPYSPVKVMAGTSIEIGPK